MSKCQRSFQPHEKKGKFPLLAANVFPKSDKKLEQFSAYMLCCFKNYASTLVICKVVKKLKMVMLGKSKDFQTYMIYIQLEVLRSKFSDHKYCNILPPRKTIKGKSYSLVSSSN